MSEQRLSVRAFTLARVMYDSDPRGQAPKLEDFEHLDAAPFTPTAVVPPAPRVPPGSSDMPLQGRVAAVSAFMDQVE